MTEKEDIPREVIDQHRFRGEAYIGTVPCPREMIFYERPGLRIAGPVETDNGNKWLLFYNMKMEGLFRSATLSYWKEHDLTQTGEIFVGFVSVSEAVIISEVEPRFRLGDDEILNNRPVKPIFTRKDWHRETPTAEMVQTIRLPPRRKPERRNPPRICLDIQEGISTPVASSIIETPKPSPPTEAVYETGFTPTHTLEIVGESATFRSVDVTSETRKFDPGVYRAEQVVDAVIIMCSGGRLWRKSMGSINQFPERYKLCLIS